MNCTTSAWVAGTTAVPRPSRGNDDFVHVMGAVAYLGWLSSQQTMATIKRPARHLGILTT